MILMGFSQAGFMIIVHTIIQIMSPDYVRGRIAGVYSMYVGGSMALFNFINGFSADYIDPGYSLALQGLIFTLIVFVYRNHEVLFYIFKIPTSQFSPTYYFQNRAGIWLNQLSRSTIQIDGGVHSLYQYV